MKRIIRKPDYDLEECLGCAGVEKELVANVLAEVPGEADGPNWHAIVKMVDGKFGYLTGWCDYSGWGCQDGGKLTITKTIKEAVNLAEDDTYDAVKKHIKEQLLDQIKGTQPFGLREQ